MKQKQCSKCKKWKDIIEFGKLKKSKDGHRSECKECRKLYYQQNKEHIKKKSVKNYIENKEKYKKAFIEYNQKNKENKKKYDKKYREKNKDKIKKRLNEYMKDHKKERIEYYKIYHKSNARYKTYSKFFNDSKLNDDNISIEIKCEYCDKYFIPSNRLIKSKIQQIKGQSRGCNLYCSEECKILNQNPITSKAEKEIQNFISKNFTIQIIKNDRFTILNEKTGYYLELDIYLPELNKAIEYNGTYWHSLPKAIKHDKIKQKECKKLGIKLLIIHEEDYIFNKKKELDKIKDFIEK